MPSDPQHPMDQPLRSYARKRREDAGEPPALHPANRALLRAEAAKLRPRAATERRSVWAWLGVYWPRLAFASAVSVALAVAVWNFLPERERLAPAHTMARLDELKDTKLVEKEKLERPLASRVKDQPLPPPATLADEVQQLRMKKEGAPAETESRSLALRPTPVEPGIAGRNADGAAAVRSRVVGQKAQTNFTAPLADGRLDSRGAAAFGVAPTPAPATSEFLFAMPSGGSAPAATAGGIAGQDRFYRTLPAANAPISPTPAKPVLAPAPAPAPAPTSADPMARFGGAGGPVAATDLFRRAPLAVAETSIPLQQAGTTGKRLRYQRSENPGALAARSEPAAAPLAYFDFEQIGESVRLIEADGSLYQGRLTTTNTAVFRVHGTNRASRKAVSVEGQFLGEESAPSDAVAARLTRPRGAPSRPLGDTKTPAGKAATDLATTSTQSNSVSAGHLLLRIRTEGTPETRFIAVPTEK